MNALVLTYHAVDDGDGPLHVDPATFAAHLDCIVESGVRVMTVRAMASSLHAADTSARTLAITFDDGLATVPRVAAPLLAERDLVATVFCVAGHVGGENDWPSARPGGPRLRLAEADELADLARGGWEIGCHGMTHAPIRSNGGDLDRELIDSKQLLEDLAGASVTTFAYPYGARPTPAAARVVASTYAAACSTTPGTVDSASDPHALPRVDAHYLRRPRLLRAALDGSLGPYLRARRLGATARRVVTRDYASSRGQAGATG